MLTVLIVEDNRPFRESLKETLRTRFPSLRVEEAGNKTDAVLMIERVRPDIILMDIRLPDASGLELTRTIKASGRPVSVAIVTSHDLAEYREAASEYGADHFVYKGSSCWEKISAILREAIRERQSGTQAIKTPAGDS